MPDLIEYYSIVDEKDWNDLIFGDDNSRLGFQGVSLTFNCCLIVSILTIYKPSLGSWPHNKFGPDRFNRFYVYRLQTDNQTGNTYL